jgi:hypothetical protein
MPDAIVRKWYRLTVHSAGCIRDEREHHAKGLAGFGWSAERINILPGSSWGAAHRDLVAISSCGVFVGIDLLDTLYLHPGGRMVLKLGSGRKLWKVDEGMIEQIREQQAHPCPPRSERKAEVDRRNAGICRFLLRKAGVATTVAVA